MSYRVRVEENKFIVPVPGTNRITRHDKLFVTFDEPPAYTLRGISFKFGLPGELEDFALTLESNRVFAAYSDDTLPVKMRVRHDGVVVIEQSDFLTPPVRKCAHLSRRLA